MNAHESAFFGRQVVYMQYNFGDEAQRSLAAGNEAAEIKIGSAGGKRRHVYQQIDGIAGVAAFHRFFRKLAAYFFLMGFYTQHATYLFVHFAFEGRQFTFGMKIIEAQGFKHHFAAIA